MKNLLVLQNLNTNQKTNLESKLSSYYQISYPESYDKSYLQKIIKDVDVCFGSFLADDVLEKAKCLKLIQLPGTGVDKLNLSLLKKMNISVAKVNSHSDYVAEFAVSMLLDLTKKISFFDRSLRTSNIQELKRAGVNFNSKTLFNKKVGIIGYGHIGKKIAELIRPFNVEILANSRNNDFKNPSTLSTLIEESDVVFICCPLTPNTKDLIGMEEFKKSKNSSLWINVSRGPIVNLDAIAKAIETNEISGFGLDNWYSERNDALKILSKFDNVLLSPYRAIFLEDENPNINQAIDDLASFGKKDVINKKVDLENGY